VANQAKAQGFVVGRDISIVTFDHGCSRDNLPTPTPLFTSLRLDLDVAATTMLLALQEILETGTRKRRAPILLAPDLVLGETTSIHSLQNIEEDPILRNQNLRYGSP
jgi:DNA-binding LacI/PurR family transcriptional regulator